MNTDKLNELVAVMVMGWKWDVRAHLYGINGAWVDERGRPTSGLLWNPSTSIADAWKVVEKMKNHNMVLYPHEHEDGALVTAMTRDWEKVDVRESTMPLAITIAALRAVGVSEEEINE